MQSKLKLRKNTEESGHRRTRTDYQNIKKMIDNYTKPPSLIDSNKLAGFTRIAQQHRMDSKITASYRRQKNASITILQTQHKEPSKTKGEKLRYCEFLGRQPITIKGTKKQHKELRAQQMPSSRKPFEGANRYQIEHKVGSGTFGVVNRARDKKTLEIVAIKKVFQDRRYKNRQLQILKELNHPNVLFMRDHFFTYENDKQYLNVVMDYYPMNLLEFIAQNKTKPRIPKIKLKVLAFQMFKSLLYLQEKAIGHRDIKPHNFLVDETGWNIVICDFGSAKVLVEGQQNISYICSRCYRPPELIIGNTQYNTKIDVWSTGCVLAEMVTGDPLFKSNGNMEQFIEIVKVLGTPTTSDLLEMNPKCDLEQFKIPYVPKKNWMKVLKCGDFGDGVGQLLEQTLRYSPKKRLSPEEILGHPFFDELRVQAIYEHLRKEQKIPALFNFNSELKTDKFNFLIPDWYNKKQ